MDKRQVAVNLIYSKVHKLQVLQLELEGFHSQLSDLSQLSNSLTKQMDNPTIVHLTAQETAMRQKLFALQQVIRILRNINRYLDICDQIFIITQDDSSRITQKYFEFCVNISDFEQACTQHVLRIVQAVQV